jgi:DNA uptake protein ComE-like DNA-binding protein
MSRFRTTPTQLFLSVAVAAMACTSGTDKASDTATAMADTGAATIADTSAAAAMPTPSNVPTASNTGGDTTKIVPININTATDAEILAIPGMGPRMLREFKEYRPYTSIEQFRREMGKYVDKNEVARLEKYIVIK